jgi:hypothetical protein
VACGRRWFRPASRSRVRIFSGPKCSGGPSAGCAVAVAVADGGCYGLLSSSTSPWERVGLTGLFRGAGELSRVSRLSYLSLGSGRGEPKCSPLTLPAAAARVVVHLALRRRAGIGRGFRQKFIPVLVSGSATTTSSDVVNLLGGVGCEASCLVFDFPGEKAFLGLVSGWRFDLGRDED